MIDHLDNLLRHLLIDRVSGLTDESQVRFQPPDSDWRTYIANLNRPAVNVYLIELREDRQLRSNARVQEYRNGSVYETPAPRWIDCHYLITAWSPAIDTPSVEPTVDEHALLYKVATVLLSSAPIVPREVYAPAAVPAGLAALGPYQELPTTVLLQEGFTKYAEFWGTMGPARQWRPVIHLVVTLPVILRMGEAGRMVTSRVIEFRQTGGEGAGDVWVQIGGQVLRKQTPTAQPRPVWPAWVRLETLDDELLQVVETTELGRFSFGGLRPGKYRLRAGAEGLNPTWIDVDVPSETGDYDLVFP